MTRFVALVAVLASLGCDAPRDAELVVLAASSLTDAFTQMESEFEASHSVDIKLGFGGSHALRAQLEQGAPADVFASANSVHFEALSRSGKVGEAGMFARNRLVLAVPKTNPSDVQTLADLPRARRIVVGAPDAPIGMYTRAMLEAATRIYGDSFGREVARNIVSEESNVRLVLAKVAMGEADAAIVYETDAASRADVLLLPIPEELEVFPAYFLGTVTETPKREEAELFVRFVQSSEGQAILRQHGFSRP